KEEFDRAMPKEFWRELVDRVAAEVPGTLLLAEAFWLLEGYFVRTLGMHRVYNSAFMNMLRDEENANYRSVIKNTLEFDPEVLKRYVNFMNNPDERTAVDQFGKGDKYFGVCTLMATLPGLPMFGHGQIEGYSEKYGMEFRRAYKNEDPDPWLIARHEREISPLLHRRAAFAEVENFLLYDFYTDSGQVNEDVYAYSNRHGDDRSLVIFNNRYADTRGWIRLSAGYMDKSAKHIRQRTLGESFGLSGDDNMFVAFRDALSGLEFLHHSRDVAEKGLRVELGAYKSYVFLDWRDVKDDGVRPWRTLCDMLAGRGVPSLEDALRNLELKPVHDSLRTLLDPALVKTVVALTQASSLAKPVKTAKPTGKPSLPSLEKKSGDVLDDLTNRARIFIREAHHYATSPAAEIVGLGSHRQWNGDEEKSVQSFRRNIEAALRLAEIEKQFSEPWSAEAAKVIPTSATVNNAAPIWSSVIAWAAADALGQCCDIQDPEVVSAQIFDALRLREVMAEAFAAAGAAGDDRWRAAARVRASFAHAPWAPAVEESQSRSSAVFSWLHDPDVAWLIGVHEWKGERYFNKESFEQFLWWISLRALLTTAAEKTLDRQKIDALEKEIQARLKAAADAGYRVEALLESGSVRQPAATSKESIRQEEPVKK
ncbi:MAG TPA: alpha-amylase family protein, partial [Terriglobales bacterium]|nr:alpha-amylase family protein [Terriglobales bacterium]